MHPGAGSLETLYPIKPAWRHPKGPIDPVLHTQGDVFPSRKGSPETVQLAGVNPPWDGDMAADDTLRPPLRNQPLHLTGQADLNFSKCHHIPPGINWRASLPTNRGIVIGSPPFSILSTRPSMNTPSTSTPAPVGFPAALTRQAMNSSVRVMASEKTGRPRPKHDPDDPRLLTFPGSPLRKKSKVTPGNSGRGIWRTTRQKFIFRILIFLGYKTPPRPSKLTHREGGKNPESGHKHNLSTILFNIACLMITQKRRLHFVSLSHIFRMPLHYPGESNPNSPAPTSTI